MQIFLSISKEMSDKCLLLFEHLDVGHKTLWDEESKIYAGLSGPSHTTPKFITSFLCPTAGEIVER